MKGILKCKRFNLRKEHNVLGETKKMLEHLFCFMGKGRMNKSGLILLTKAFCISTINTNDTKLICRNDRGENMVISIRDGSDIPIYQQIRNQIVLGISDGRLQPGEQLPTVRALAEEIGINTMTVSKAYQILKAEGYIITDRRSGARVQSAFRRQGEMTAENKELLKKIISEAKISGMSWEAFFQVCERYYREGNVADD